MLLAAAEAAIYDAQTLSLRGKFYFPKKNKSHTYEPRFVCWWRERDWVYFVCFSEKKKVWDTRRGKSGFPKRSHGSRAYGMIMR